ncbi:MAG: hypothetical protein K0Q79_2322 [Flavipsychrobacter sp.]|jgi:hypothetical protein|nr:hypothetical protein [Flavipsychrobacter sp.]
MTYDLSNLTSKFGITKHFGELKTLYGNCVFAAWSRLGGGLCVKVSDL